MKAIKIFTLTFAITTPFSASAENSGNEMLALCKSATTIIENPRGEFTTDDMFNSGKCIGFINGLIRENVYLNAYVPKKNRICIDPKVSYGQSAMVLVRYLEATPQRLHLPDILLANEAFAKAFPCI